MMRAGMPCGGHKAAGRLNLLPRSLQCQGNCARLRHRTAACQFTLAGDKKKEKKSAPCPTRWRASTASELGKGCCPTWEGRRGRGRPHRSSRIAAPCHAKGTWRRDRAKDDTKSGVESHLSGRQDACSCTACVGIARAPCRAGARIYEQAGCQGARAEDAF